VVTVPWSQSRGHTTGVSAWRYGFAMGKQSTHLVWDWNGTLLDDIEAVIGATNAAFG
jgi:hypothetical protein